jgi:hypothetical protein
MAIHQQSKSLGRYLKWNGERSSRRRRELRAMAGRGWYQLGNEGIASSGEEGRAEVKEENKNGDSIAPGGSWINVEVNEGGGSERGEAGIKLDW